MTGISVKLVRELIANMEDDDIVIIRLNHPLTVAKAYLAYAATATDDDIDDYIVLDVDDVSINLSEGNSGRFDRDAIIGVNLPWDSFTKDFDIYYRKIEKEKDDEQ